METLVVLHIVGRKEWGFFLVCCLDFGIGKSGMTVMTLWLGSWETNVCSKLDCVVGVHSVWVGLESGYPSGLRAQSGPMFVPSRFSMRLPFKSLSTTMAISNKALHIA
jgi:hypothetical protein